MTYQRVPSKNRARLSQSVKNYSLTTGHGALLIYFRISAVLQPKILLSLNYILPIVNDHVF